MNIHRYAGKTANRVGTQFYNDMLSETEKNGSNRNALEERLDILDEKHSRDGYRDLDEAPLSRGEIDFLVAHEGSARNIIIEKPCIILSLKARKRPKEG